MEISPLAGKHFFYLKKNKAYDANYTLCQGQILDSITTTFYLVQYSRGYNCQRVVPLTNLLSWFLFNTKEELEEKLKHETRS